MKTIQQVLGFVQGWQLAIKSNEAEQNDDNDVYKTLLTIEKYIKEE